MVCTCVIVSLSFIRLISLAVSHYRHRLLSQCLGVWLLEVGRERGRREREREEARHRDKVQAFLKAAAVTAARSTVAATGGEGVGKREVAEDEREEEVEDEEEKEQSSTRCGKKGNQMRDGGEVKRSHPVIWQKARKHVVSFETHTHTHAQANQIMIVWKTF